jgi:acyl carrier protein
VIKDQIKKVMAGIFKIDLAEIDDEASTDTIEGWDSLRHLSLMISLESEFDVVFSDEDFADLTSLPLIELEIRSQLDQ